MKIGNAFSLNMVQLPASWSAQKISVEQIKRMMSDSSVKQLARKLMSDGLRYEEVEGVEYIHFAGKHGHLEWYNDASHDQKIKSLKKIGLLSSDEILDAIYCMESSGYGCPEVVSLESVIGHEDTARLVSDILGFELPANRTTVKLQPGEKMIVAQYSGPRLPEGATSLPDGAKIEFVLVEVN